MTSSKLIPAISVAGLSLTGCTDPIIGDWELTKINDDAFPLTGSYTAGGITCSYEIAGGMSLAEQDDKSIGGELFISYSVGCEGFDTISSRSANSVTAAPGDKGAYTITDAEDSADTMACTLDGDMLMCTQSDDTIEMMRVIEE